MSGGKMRAALVVLSVFLGSACGAPEHADAVPASTVAAKQEPVAPPTPDDTVVVSGPPEGWVRLEPVGGPRSGTLVLGRARDRTYAVIADADERALVVVDVDQMREVSRHELEGRPEHVLIAPNGLVYVTVASHARVEQLAMLEGRLAPTGSTSVAADPAGMAVTEDGTLLVASRWGHALSVFDATTLKLEREIPLARDPYAIALLEDGRALVTHVVGGRVSVVDHARGEVSELDATRHDVKRLRMSRKYGGPRRGPGPGIQAHRHAVQAFAATRIGDGRVLISSALADGSPALQGGGYGGGTIDVRTHAGVELAVSADGKDISVPQGTARDMNTDCFLPRASAWDPDSELLLVACAGTRRIVAVHTRGAASGRIAWAEILPEGPTGVALDTSRRRWLAWSQFAGELTAGDLPKQGAPETKSQSLTLARNHPLPPAVARGRLVFHSAGSRRKAALDGRACASCHPSGRDDATTWHTAIGPRQTPILVGRIEDTAPYGWNGRSLDVDTHLKMTLQRLHSQHVTADDRADLLAYVRHLEPPVLPPPEPSLVEAGRALFVSEGRCSSCHPLGTTTDGEQHDLGSASKLDAVRTFNTPTLRFVARSAPYYHDGRYPTLDALLRDPATGMGSHADLNRSERQALLAFLGTL